MTEVKTVEFKINMRYRQGYSGILVGQSREFPFIIVQGKTVDELIDEMIYEAKVYFNTFPEEGKKALEKYGEIIVVDHDEQQPKRKEEEEGWSQETIPLTIPIRTH